MAEYEDDFDDYKDDFDDAPAPAPAPKPAPAPAPSRGAPATVAKAPAPAPAVAAVKLTGRIRVGGAAPAVPKPAARIKPGGGSTRTQVSRLLDVDSYVELFAMAPATALEQLQDKVRLGAWRHASAQAPEETRGIATQTDAITSAGVGVQAPDDLGAATKTAAGAAASAAAAANGLSFDPRVVDFLCSAGRVIEALCEANLAAAARKTRLGQAALARPGAAHGAALGRVAPVPIPAEGPLAPLLRGRAVQSAALSPTTPHTRLVVLGPLAPAAAKAAGVLPAWASATLLLVLERQTQPAAVLATFGDVTAAAFSPDASMVVAGTAEGAVVLWDLEGAWSSGEGARRGQGYRPRLLAVVTSSQHCPTLAALRRACMAAPDPVWHPSPAL